MPFHMNLCFELHFRFHGCSDLISQLLIRTLHSDLTKLTSFFQLFFTDYIFHLIIASYKILICDHMPGNFQKIAFRLYLQPEMSPSAPLDCKSFADRFTDIIKAVLICLQFNFYRILFSRSDQKLFYMLKCHRLF